MERAHKLRLLAQVYLLALNHEEAVAVTGGANDARLLDACSAMASTANPTLRILVSAGADGAYIFENGAWSHHKAVPVEVISTAGAGDALLAGAIAGLAAGLPLADRNDVISSDKRAICSAVDLGLSLAAFSVMSPHTIHPGATLESLLSFARGKGIAVDDDLQNTGSRVMPSVRLQANGNRNPRHFHC
jgi:sugar/nucleoside kinase (ribokinase family)